MNICMCVNSKYIRYMYIALLSLFEHNSKKDIAIYVLQRDLTDSDKNLIRNLCERYKKQVCFIKIDESDFAGFPTTDKFPLEAYFRLKMIEKIPNDVDKILYIDVDVIINGALNELYDINIDGYYFAAAIDMVMPELNEERQQLFNRTDDLSYFNSGVMLFNLKEMRKNVQFQDFIDAVYSLDYKVEYADQEILNYLYYNKVRYIDGFRWNYMVVVERFEDKELDCEPVIYHYCGFNPWQQGPKSSKYSIWWEYARKTDFYTDFLEELLLKSEEYIREDYKRKDYWEEMISQMELLQYKSLVLDALLYLESNFKENNTIADTISFSENIYFYGAGNMTELIYKMIKRENIDININGIIDKNKEGLFYDLPIINDLVEYSNMLKNISGECILIVSPLRNVYSIKLELMDNFNGNVNVKVITALEFFDMIMKKCGLI